mmetsp:Transcript_51705/g.166037  ORF Transcript_51705/g.166037 Transcript_51705/m.166037 type:complete len:97 (+) Transcript_51705:123-413(+)
MRNVAPTGSWVKKSWTRCSNGVSLLLLSRCASTLACKLLAFTIRTLGKAAAHLREPLGYVLPTSEAALRTRLAHRRCCAASAARLLHGHVARRGLV